MKIKNCNECGGHVSLYHLEEHGTCYCGSTDLSETFDSKGHIRDPFGGIMVRWESLSSFGPTGVAINAPASGTNWLKPDEARETAEALRRGGDALSRLFKDENISELADALDEAADRYDETKKKLGE